MVYYTTTFKLVLCILLLIVPIIIQYFFFSNAFNSVHISLYGFYMIIYTIIQLTFAMLNNRNVPLLVTKNQDCKKKCNILVVGYKEKDEYFRMCLNSVKEQLDNSRVNRIIIVIDGNDNEDMYMVDIFENTLMNGTVINLNSFDELDSHMNYIKDNKVICITQPHNSKRQALYTGFKISILDTEAECILCTDSDTVLDKMCIDNALSLFDDEKLGGVAGNLSIYTKYDSSITFLSSIRYFFAFNLERAYQSFNNYVLCISGPIGFYRLKYIDEILEDWINQKFLNKRCTYGDDRHLTNLLLSHGYKIIYSPEIKAETETPSSILRFYRQQTRWTKSAYREFLWSFLNMKKSKAFMITDMVYTIIFPFLVMGYLIYILWLGNLYNLQLYIGIIFISGCIKTIYGMVIQKNIEMLFYILYILPYVFIVFPAKIYALCTLTDISWGTGERKSNTIINKFQFDIIFLVVWDLFLLASCIYHIYINVLHSNYLNIYNFLYIISIGSFYLLLFIGMTMYIKIKPHEKLKKVL